MFEWIPLAMFFKALKINKSLVKSSINREAEVLTKCVCERERDDFERWSLFCKIGNHLLLVIRPT